MSVFVQYGKVGKPIVYNTLPAASEDLKGVCGQVEDKIYICDGSNWNLFSNTTLKNLLDATQSCYSLFRNYKGTSIDNLITYNDTSNVNDMSYMFYGCNSLTSIPQLNTSNVTNMSSMFYICGSLTSIPLLDTSKVIHMSYMFYGCSKLTIVPALDVSNVKNFSDAFINCSSLKSILMTGMTVSFDISASTQFEESDLVTILNNLATVTTTQTLKMGATNLAKLTDEDKAIATNKGWTLA